MVTRTSDRPTAQRYRPTAQIRRLYVKALVDVSLLVERCACLIRITHHVHIFPFHLWVFEHFKLITQAYVRSTQLCYYCTCVWGDSFRTITCSPSLCEIRLATLYLICDWCDWLVFVLFKAVYTLILTNTNKIGNLTPVCLLVVLLFIVFCRNFCFVLNMN